MVFVERFTSLKTAPPFRCYIDECGLKEVFGSVENARKYIFSIVEDNKEKFKDRDYLIAVVYGLEDKKIAEVFGYKEMGENWPENTEVVNLVFENGKPLTESWSCENVDIVKGAEAKHRRKTKSLDEFLKNVPHLDNLQPLIDAGIIDNS